MQDAWVVFTSALQSLSLGKLLGCARIGRQKVVSFVRVEKEKVQALPG